MQPPSSRVQRVAVVGAGISGIAAAKYLSDAELSVTVFERADSLGGIWVYDDRIPPDPPYPNVVPSSAEATPRPLDRTTDDSQFADRESITALQILHAPPGPAYVSLRNNIPTCLMSFRDQMWPDGTHDYINHEAVLDYVRAFAKRHDVESLVQFNTRVIRVTKKEDGWAVETCSLSVEHDRVQHKIQYQHFDAVVICAGHHSAPKVPDIRGLKELKATWPRHVTHSKAYRRPQDIIGKVRTQYITESIWAMLGAVDLSLQNIVLVGNGASAYDIAHELKDRVEKLYQVTKVNSGYVPVQFMPKIVERVAEIAFVENDTGSKDDANGLEKNDEPDMPSIRVHLIDGTILDNIHSIILCTGYVRSYPFLTQYHDDHAVLATADDTVLITDGSMVHNLHKDIFYMPEPTLAFVGVSTGTTSLSLHEYQAIMIASVLSGKARLPSEAAMRDEYQARIEKNGIGRSFHNLMGQEVEYVRELVAWVNSSRQSDFIEGYSDTWLAFYEKRKEWLKEVFKKRDNAGDLKPEGQDITGICTSGSPGYL